MGITRRNKIRKRKKKHSGQKQRISAASTASKRLNASMIFMHQRRVQTIQSRQKKARLAFRINNELDIEQYFKYDEKLIDVMNFIMNDTGMTEFIFISQYPPIHIDSIYLDRKMSANIGLFDNHHDEKSNESKYDEIQNKLQKTLYELNLVPSCRVFIQPKFKGHPRAVNYGDNNFVLRIIYFLMDVIKIALEYGWNGIVFVFGVIWMILSVPLKMLGIDTKSRESQNRQNKMAGNKRMNDGVKRKSKLPAYKKDPRFVGKIGRLDHSERDQDKNRLNNGNSTMFGGDEDAKK